MKFSTNRTSVVAVPIKSIDGMKFALTLLVLFFVSSICYSNKPDTSNALQPISGLHDNESMLKPTKKIPIDTVIKHLDTLLKSSKDLKNTISNGMKKEGIRTYMKKHADVFLPVVIFIVLYLVWLSRRARSRN